MALNRTAALALSTSLCGALILGTAGTAVATTTDSRPSASAAAQHGVQRDLDALTEATRTFAAAPAADRAAARALVEARLADALTDDPEPAAANTPLSLLTPVDDDVTDTGPAGQTTTPVQTEDPNANAGVGTNTATTTVDTTPPPVIVDPGPVKPCPMVSAARTALKASVEALVKAVSTGNWDAARQAFGNVQQASAKLAAAVWAKASAASR
ncbi:hypothetical protein GCM10010329_54270 [Streptomyces spiroverticillatus]|uniref:Tat pathway signal sequence domain protein n=1 Tax=Streptomyces finlayi TaxID=67296 RepID=A0A918X3B8_9ACTN|nr:hypothetical protein [Streptomyces finlayi]GHA24071.1 hypothetical protein GCM10010329_54270 [Streptomyces spiroverticillatus]GHD06101.1 hypothetical protein GCM10010334_57530 [Streptomyces finlayi]